MTKIRVLVADDSVTVRKHLTQVLMEDARFEVVGEARDGKEAFALCQQLRPDVVTLDIVMPVMDGLEATECIMAYCPTPILIVSSSLHRREVYSTYDALAAGAVDVIDKSSAGAPDGAWEQQFLSQLRRVSHIKVITHPRAKLGRNAARRTAAPLPPSPPHPGKHALVAIGASTGGPSTILTLLSALPADFPLPILFVLHLGEAFAESFVTWLDQKSPLPVSQAVDGAPLPLPGDGRVLMAPPDRHLEVRNGRLHLHRGPERFSCRPSVDVLFESVASELGSRAIGCLLTGMGRDGAAGLLRIKQAGGFTVAQDEATSVVYGMPREAALLGAADAVLPLDRIAPTLLALAGVTETGSL